MEIKEYKAFFLDKNDEIVESEIEMRATEKSEAIDPQKFLHINCFNACGQQIGYITMHTEPYLERIYLDIIYVFDEYRSTGVGQKMFELALQMVSGFDEKKLVGCFSPGNYASERGNIPFNEDLGKMRANNFYVKNGFEVVVREEFLQHPEIYPKVSDQDFRAGETTDDACIVIKYLTNESPKFVQDENRFYCIDNLEELKGNGDPKEVS